MNILLFLIPVSIALMGLAVWAFVWAVRRGQFDDLDTPALDILREDVHDRRASTPSTATTDPDDAERAGDAPHRAASPGTDPRGTDPPRSDVARD